MKKEDLKQLPEGTTPCPFVQDVSDYLGFGSTDTQGKKNKSTTSNNNNINTVGQLMVEQVEYANVVVLNKTDLVDEEQLETIEKQLSLLNSHAKILKARSCNIDVETVLNTKLYKPDDFAYFLSDDEVDLGGNEPDCCRASRAKGESPCCRRARTLDSGLSQVLLASRKLATTRHEARFGMTSFIYRARRPFSFKRFHDDFVDKFFLMVEREEEEEEEEEEEDDTAAVVEDDDDENNDSSNVWKTKYLALADKHDEALRFIEVLKERLGPDALQELVVADSSKHEEENDDDDNNKNNDVAEQQKEATAKQKIRDNEFGTLLRSKGLVWMANSHDTMGLYSQAGNTVTIEQPTVWKCLDKRAYEGTTEELSAFRGEEWKEPWGDRRQDLVFIGTNLLPEKVQETLDACLLNDEEMELGVDGWKATLGDLLLQGDDE